MKHTVTYFFLCAWAMFLAPCLPAQECKDAIRRATELYEKGHLNDVRSVLTDECIQIMSDIRERQDAYYLLAVASLYIKDLDSAKKSLLIILNENPEYVCKRTTPIGFQKFYETFRTKPVLILGGKAGLNSAQIKSIRSYSLDDQTVGQQASYKSAYGFQISGVLMVPIWKNIDAIGELGFRQFNYEYKNKLFGFSDIRFKETQNWIELPLSLRFNLSNHYRFLEEKSFLNRLNPYFLAGISTTFLLGSQGTAFRSDKINTEKGFETNKQVSVTNMRQKIGVYAIGGAGLEYKKGRMIWSIEARYLHGFAQTVKTKNRYINSDLLFSYGYVDSDIKLRNLSVSVGVAYPIYSPKQQRDFYIKDLSIKDLEE